MARGKNLTDAVRAEIIRVRKADRLTYEQLAERFGYCVSTIENVCRGRDYYWTGMRHNPPDKPRPAFKAPPTGSASGFIRPIDYSRLVSGR